MALKVTLLFNVTTQATDPTSAIPHTGGWSESWWYRSSAFLTEAGLQRFLSARANMLPFGSSIIGVRQGLYTLQGNKILPQGTSVFKSLYGGNQAFANDLPQVALEMSGLAAGAINANRFTLRSIPDSQMANGEYTPSPAFKALVTIFRAHLIGNINGGLNAFGFVGRDLTRPTSNVHSVAAGVVTLAANIGGVQGTDYLRFHRVKNDQGLPISGAFLITNIAGNVYTVQGLAGQAVTVANGTARIDALSQFDFTQVNPVRAAVKKIGRPSQGYRGRQSKRRVA